MSEAPRVTMDQYRRVRGMLMAENRPDLVAELDALNPHLANMQRDWDASLSQRAAARAERALERARTP